MEQQTLNKSEDIQHQQTIKNNLEFKILTKEHRDAALILIARCFHEVGYFEKAIQNSNNLSKLTFLDWVEYIDFFMPICSTNNLSVICLDTKNHKIAGALLSFDFHQEFPQEFNDKYIINEYKAISYVTQTLIEAFQHESKIISGNRSGVDLCLLGVDSDYRNQKIATKLIEYNIKVIETNTTKKYDYVTIEATNSVTTKIINQLNFDCIFTKKLSDFIRHDKPMVSDQDPQVNHFELVAAVKKLHNTMKEEEKIQNLNIQEAL